MATGGKRFEITKTPAWILTLQDLSGYSGIKKAILAEQAYRQADDYVPPYPRLQAFVSDLKFETAMGTIILMNCILIALQANEKNNRNAIWYEVMEYIFSTIFVAEWIVRLMVSGWLWVTGIWNFADTFIVWSGVAALLVPRFYPDLGIEILRKFSALRALRLVRLAQAVRFLPGFKEMWLLLQGLILSFRTLLWTLLIILVVLYVFAIASVEMIGKHDDFIRDPYLQERFGTLMNSMFTLFQVMTLDTWADAIVRPLMKKQPHLCLYFIFFITVSVFVLMNLITAVIVENAFTIAKDDEEMEAKQIEKKNQEEIKGLALMFKDLDEDQSGELNKREFENALTKPKFLNKLKLLDMNEDECMEVWDLLDDGDGLLTVEEFTNGLRRMKAGARSKDILDMLKRLKNSLHQAESLQHDVDCLGDVMEDLQEELNTLTYDLDLVRDVCGVLSGAFSVPAKKKRRKKNKEEDAEAASSGAVPAPPTALPA
jgi:Ca2+-binding EF-hand superfamily protein